MTATKARSRHARPTTSERHHWRRPKATNDTNKHNKVLAAKPPPAPAVAPDGAGTDRTPPDPAGSNAATGPAAAAEPAGPAAAAQAEPGSSNQPGATPTPAAPPNRPADSPTAAAEPPDGKATDGTATDGT
jgi:hypothetical protein